MDVILGKVTRDEDHCGIMLLNQSAHTHACTHTHTHAHTHTHTHTLLKAMLRVVGVHTHTVCMHTTKCTHICIAHYKVHTNLHCTLQSNLHHTHTHTHIHTHAHTPNCLSGMTHST